MQGFRWKPALLTPVDRLLGQHSHEKTPKNHQALMTLASCPQQLEFHQTLVTAQRRAPSKLFSEQLKSRRLPVDSLLVVGERKGRGKAPVPV